MQQKHFYSGIILLIALIFSTISFANDLTVKEFLLQTKTIAYPKNGRMVNKTVAEELQLFAQNAKIVLAEKNQTLNGNNVIRIAIADEGFIQTPANAPKDNNWMYCKFTTSGNGVLLVSQPNLLYSLFCLLKDDWSESKISEFENGKFLTTKFSWLRGDDGFLANKKRFTRAYDPESTVKELARMGCSHLTINSLATPYAIETGPPGEIYYRFYDGAPDLDQFVETDLNKGMYPPEYLEANFRLLQEQAQLAIKYGLTPGLYICNPRSVPEAILIKFPFLRGARVDHPYRSYRPRYNLTLAHPLVRWHYSEMLKKIMNRIPEISFITTFLNDSGSGFEYTARLYTGRNGGMFVAREWMTHDEFARDAANNIVRYYKTIRDAGQEINPDFHIIAGLFAIPEEEPYVMDGMDNGIDLVVRISDKNDLEKSAREQELVKRGSNLYTNGSAKGALVLGTPAPWFIHENISNLIAEDLDKVSLSFDPPSLAPFDVNREVLRSFQLGLNSDINKIIEKAANDLVGKNDASKLIEIWKTTNEAVKNFPNVPLYGTSWAFEMYRFWNRPFVPNIDKIPESDREYYEKYSMAIFNNPHRIDFGADVLWEIINIEQGDQIVNQFDSKSNPALEKAIKLSENVVKEINGNNQAERVFIDLRDRLLGLQCYYRTLRNIGAWVAGVHGYLQANDETEKQQRLNMVREMMTNELENSKNLLELWQRTKINFVPVAQFGETWHSYGENLGELIPKKIALMEKHKNDLPYIDPNYRWRMPTEYQEYEKLYLKEK